MYQALYRKWRPQTFTDVCGQEAVTTALKNELKSGHLSHAYLFTGCRGTGKTTCAKILAKAVNCEHPVDGDPCNECALCRGIDDGSVLDVTEIDAASNNGVNDIRDLRDEVAFTPVSGKYRVYIIDEVHMLSAGAFNALLKTLEEPPAHVIFILATTEVHKLPATILSRCQRFDFGRIRPETIAARLDHVAREEGLTLTPEAAMLLARLADGAMRDALSLLDQCSSTGNVIDVPTVIAVTGMAGQETLRRLTDCVWRQDSAAGLMLIDEIYRTSKDMERLCAEWIGYARNLMILKQMPDPAELIVAAPEEIDEMRALAEQTTLPRILHLMDVLQDTLERLRAGVNRRVEMEMAVIRLCDARLDTDMTALVRRISDLEDRLTTGAPVPPASPTPATPEPVAPEPPPVPEAPAETEETPFTKWGDVLERLRSTCIPLYGVLSDSQAVLKGNLLLICTDNALFKELFLRDNNKELLMDAIRSVTGSAYRIGLRRTTPPPKSTDDPLQKLMEQGRQAGIPVNEK